MENAGSFASIAELKLWKSKGAMGAYIELDACRKPCKKIVEKIIEKVERVKRVRKVGGEGETRIFPFPGSLAIPHDYDSDDVEELRELQNTSNPKKHPLKNLPSRHEKRRRPTVSKKQVESNLNYRNTNPEGKTFNKSPHKTAHLTLISCELLLHAPFPYLKASRHWFW